MFTHSFGSWSKVALCLIASWLICRSNVANSAEVEAFAVYDHTSALFVGCPFHCSDPPEPQQDYLAGGVTITAGKRKAWEIDLSHGVKRVDRWLVTQGSQFTVRYYPGRGR
jgi:hypothetical protein